MKSRLNDQIFWRNILRLFTYAQSLMDTEGTSYATFIKLEKLSFNAMLRKVHERSKTLFQLEAAGTNGHLPQPSRS